MSPQYRLSTSHLTSSPPHGVTLPPVSVCVPHLYHGRKAHCHHATTTHTHTHPTRRGTPFTPPLDTGGELCYACATLQKGGPTVAKLKAPLMSLGATQQLGKTLVFFGWKGLDVVREYVIPTNPQSPAQVIQRGYLKLAVAGIHAAEIDPGKPFVTYDATAYALLASLQPTPSTWFNEICRQWLKQLRAGGEAIVWSGGLITPGASKLTVNLGGHAATGAPVTDGKLYYGTSKTHMLDSIDATPAELDPGKDIPGLSPGVKYFVQYRPNTPADYVGANSGIYYGTPTA